MGPFPPGGRYAALGPQRYDHGSACGDYVEVAGPDGTVRAEVVDLCPTCAADTVDLSRAAFERVGPAGAQTVSVTFRLLSRSPSPSPSASPTRPPARSATPAPRTAPASRAPSAAASLEATATPTASATRAHAARAGGC